MPPLLETIEWPGWGEITVEAFLGGTPDESVGKRCETGESPILFRDAEGELCLAWVDIKTPGVIHVARVNGTSHRRYEHTTEVGSLVLLDDGRILAFARDGVYVFNPNTWEFSPWIGAPEPPYNTGFVRFNDAYRAIIGGRFALVATRDDNRWPNAGAYLFDLRNGHFVLIAGGLYNGNGFEVLSEPDEGGYVVVVFCDTLTREAYSFRLHVGTGHFTELEVFYSGPMEGQARQDGAAAVKVAGQSKPGVLFAMYAGSGLDWFEPGSRTPVRLPLPALNPTKLAVDHEAGVIYVTTAAGPGEWDGLVLKLSGRGVRAKLGLAA